MEAEGRAMPTRVTKTEKVDSPSPNPRVIIYDIYGHVRNHLVRIG